MSESYIPFYRKYRPKNLQEVVGQEHIKKALSSAISLNKISHAYLFTGPRGTGKTSIARILAKSLNCESGPTLTPCETCASCLDVKNSTPIDVVEIDAASNRSVEDARNILEKIQYVPVHGKFKIYIIDEVHMLSNHAFNALLKTLEEPPENVIFILATTEPHKVLETIISRCQRFDFRRITTDDIISHLKEISKLEKIKIEDEALFAIAKNAAGGMRDSLALLDQISILDSKSAITVDDINRLLGKISFDMLYELTDKFIQFACQEAVELLDKIYNSGNEPSQILVNLLGYFKNLLMVKNCEKDELLIELTQLNSAQIEMLKKQVKNIDSHQITFLIERTAYYIKEVKTTQSQHLWLEVAIIDLSNLAQNTSLLALQERISKLEDALSSGTKVSYSAPAPVAVKPVTVPIEKSQPSKADAEKPVAERTISASPVKEPTKPTVKESPNTNAEKQDDLPPMPVVHHAEKNPSSDLGSLWQSLLQNISSAPTAALLRQHATPIEISPEGVIIGCKETFLKLLVSDSKKPAIDEAAQKLFNKSVQVTIKLATAEDFTSQKKNEITKPKDSSSVTLKPIKKVTLPEVEDEAPATSDESRNDVELSDDDDYVSHELAKVSKKTEAYMPSDQVSMVIKLFDGKYID